MLCWEDGLKRRHVKDASEYLFSSVRPGRSPHNKMSHRDKITTQHHTMSTHPQSSLFTPPERGSIHAILVANPSRRLYTHPLEWKEQLEHLSCELHPHALSLDHEIVGDKAMQNVPLTHDSDWNDIRGAVIEVQHCRKRKSRDEQMRSLFAKLSAVATGSQLQRSASRLPPIQC